jgi:ABC-type Mn2+/Zn2+ transport system ATPase subunit
MIQAQNLSYGHAANPQIQKNLSFSLELNSCLVIEGENGAGKSLLGRVLANIYPYKGNLENSFSHTKYMPQILNPRIHLPFSLAEVSGEKNYLLNSKQRNLAWNNASGGEKQRALIDRTFQEDADLFILDEPLNHIDQETKRALKNFLNKYFSEKKASLVLITHEGATAEWLQIPIQTLRLSRGSP